MLLKRLTYIQEVYWLQEKKRKRYKKSFKLKSIDRASHEEDDDDFFLGNQVITNYYYKLRKD